VKSKLEEIKKILLKSTGIRVSVKTELMDRDSMNRRLFIKVLKQLRELEDKRDFLVEKIGIDLSYYETAYFDIILNLFRMSFSKEQISYIQYYVYKALPNKDWDGTIILVQDGKERSRPFSTPADVWTTLKEIE
jgi:hypothetical protein